MQLPWPRGTIPLVYNAWKHSEVAGKYTIYVVQGPYVLVGNAILLAQRRLSPTRVVDRHGEDAG